jgi:hypothetical protein
MWDWNFSPGEPTTDAERTRSLPLATETAGPPWPEARTPEVATGAPPDWWTTDGGAPPAAGSPASPGASREPTEPVPISLSLRSTQSNLTDMIMFHHPYHAATPIFDAVNSGLTKNWSIET